jgi:hypothetical protein
LNAFIAEKINSDEKAIKSKHSQQRIISQNAFDQSVKFYQRAVLAIANWIKITNGIDIILDEN